MMMQSSFIEEFLNRGFHTEIDGVDLLSVDAKEAYIIKLGGRGLRDLRDAALRLAEFLSDNPRAKRGYVLAAILRLSASRARSEWELIKKVLQPSIASRMHLVALIDGKEVGEPVDLDGTVAKQFLTYVRDISGYQTSELSFSRERQLLASTPRGVTWKHLEVEKVLLNRWLLGNGPIAIGELSKQVGCSPPTAMQAIRRLEMNDLVKRRRARSVELSRYPRDRWSELFRVQLQFYPPMEFVDPTTARGAVDEILARLKRKEIPGVAIGGVVAARQWDHSFDLNGTPRIDVLLHMPTAGVRHEGRWTHHSIGEWVRRLDPALQPRFDKHRGATVLAVHHTFRHESLFLHDVQAQISYADPVETLFHLENLGLTAQAGELVRHLRKDVKR